MTQSAESPTGSPKLVFIAFERAEPTAEGLRVGGGVIEWKYITTYSKKDKTFSVQGLDVIKHSTFIELRDGDQIVAVLDRSTSVLQPDSAPPRPTRQLVG